MADPNDATVPLETLHLAHAEAARLRAERTILLAACDLAARTLRDIQARWGDNPDFPDRIIIADVLRDLDAALTQVREAPP
jgi:hypothetical protein